MKILIINTVETNRNGISSVIFNYYQALKNDKKYQIEFLINGMICNEYAEILNNDNTKFMILKTRKKNIFKYLLQLHKIIRKGKYDIVHVHSSSSLMIIDLLPALMCKAKKRIAHSHSTQCSYIKLHNILKYVLPLVANEYVACGDKAGNWMFNNREFLVLNNSIETGDFLYSQEDSKYIRENYKMGNSKILLQVGALSGVKNQVFSIEVLKLLINKGEDYKLILVGEGSLQDEIIKTVKLYGLDEYIIMIPSTNVVEKYLSAADILLLPSLYEGLPVILLEGQANGISCIVSNLVTNEIDVNDTINYQCINSGPETWVEAIISSDISRDERGHRSKVMQNVLKEKGYDISGSVQSLIAIYNS